MYKNFRTTALTAALALSSAAATAQTPILTAQAQQDQAAAQSQKRIDKLDEQASDAFQQYRAALARAESLDIYNQQLQRLVNSQTQEIASVQRQTQQIESIETGALPFMITMTDTLSELVASDVPFLLQERRERVEALRGLIDRADVSAGEKYRRIMEAYTVEAEYGRTIEAYRGELDGGGPSSEETRSVDFLRLGRVGLYYQTLDGGETGRWNAGLGKWEMLGDEFRRGVRDGLRIARKQAPPALLKLPFDAPEAGQ
mgnify:CR=1 FL=1